MSTTHRLAVIPDVHMRRKMLHFASDLHEEGYPLVFLGDYADKGPRGNDPKLLREIFAFAKTNGAVLLIGNHDLAYLYPEREEFRIGGYEPENAEEISTIYQAYKDSFKFIHRVDKYIFSHAGLGKGIIETLYYQFPDATLDDLILHLNSQVPPELFYRTEHNGGSDLFDGPMWLRPAQYEGVFLDEGLWQVVGHTASSTIHLKHNLLMIDVQLPMIIEW